VTAGALATAAAVAAALFVYSPGQVVVPGEGDADVQHNGVEAPAYADARELFAAAAEAAAAEEVEATGFWYVRTRNHRPADTVVHVESGYEVYQVFTQESWQELGGGFRSLNNLNLDTETLFPDGADRRAWEEAGSPELAHTSPDSSAFRGEGIHMFDMRTSELLGLTGDAAELEALLREKWREELARGGNTEPDTEENFDAYVREAFADTVTGPLRGDTRGALLTLAADLEGIRLVGPEEDPLGRAGYEVAVPWPAAPEDEELTTYWIIDPGTGTLLSEHRGGDRVWVAYEEAGFAEEIGEPVVPVDYVDLYGE
jgi:hypothetical protein